ncbi:hypothetical protein HOLleu_01526 [Holothuria leucospilota]|uniref:CCHC-type domain-containing protein n=1 Tax=Holothuria leucospilota TaxID=206669 RepID=A0A9Q1CNJ0_HOLLE|nr:hypothetical protein HOLleu_01526 [Holothuria leucospilota]
MPGGRDSTIVRLEFSSGASVSPPQAFTVLKNKGIQVKEIEMLQALAARNTYDLKFRSDAARVKGVSCLKGAEGLTVTPYDRSVAVTVLYLNFEVDQRLVARVLSQYGTVSDMRWCKYGSGELAGIFNGKRQCRMELDRDIPSFLFIGGSKAHIRYFGQPRTCFKCGQEGHEARSCPNRRCGKCLQVGHDKAECPNEVRCNLCGEEGHVSGACPTSYSAHASVDVEQAPEPSQAGPEYSTEELEEAAQEVEKDFLASKQLEADRMAVEEDLQLSSDSESAMSDGVESASEPPPKDPPSGEGWFDLCEGEEPSLKRSASGGVLHQGVHHSQDPSPSSQSKKVRSQETHIMNEDDVHTWSFEWGGGLHASFGSTTSCGSVILVSPRWTPLVGKVDSDHEGRLVCITVRHPCGKFFQCNVYAPNRPSDRRDFFMTLPSFVPGSAPCILAGDFNCVPDTQLDRMSTRTSSGCGVGMSELDMFIKNHDMVDVWRAQHPGLSVFTWHRPDGTDASRLDRVYSPPALSPKDCEVVTCPISDHDAVTVSFQPPESWPTGRGFWKMNTDILTEADYSEQFKARYEGWRTLKPAFSTVYS